MAADGVVLVGDAGGLVRPADRRRVERRHARTSDAVTDVLLAGDDLFAAAFEGYAQERSERMRRLRVVVHVATELRCTFT